MVVLRIHLGWIKVKYLQLSKLIRYVLDLEKTSEDQLLILKPTQKRRKMNKIKPEPQLLNQTVLPDTPYKGKLT